MNNLEQRVQKVSAASSKQVKKGAQGNPAFKGIPTTSKIYQLLSDLSAGNTNFQDYQFPLVARSLTTDASHKFYNYFKNAAWKRPTELFSSADFSDIKLFDTIDPHDIEQGILGVCYFLSALSALAEFPSRLSKVFVNQTTNQYGAYALKFYVQGVPTEVIVDDYMPCYGDRKQVTPLFSKPKGKELWVLLAEKAWGKLYKNYVASEAGRPEEALEYLTAAPSVNYMTEEQTPDEIFATILNADKKNHVMCASTNAQASEAVGLVSHHAYSVISAHQVGKHRILKLRNPWGNLEWNGDFGDNSKLWTDALKKAVGYTNANDGMFCMTPEHFKKFFSSYSVCFYHDGWEYTYVESQSERNHAEYYKFNIEDPCEIYLRIHQEDKRFYDATGTQYEYSSADLFVAKVEADGSYTAIVTDEEELHNGTYFGKRSIYPVEDMKIQLKEPGQYVVRAKIRWVQGTRGKYTLSAYAPFKINLQKTTPVKDFLRRFFKSLGKDLEKKEVGNSCSYAGAHYGPYFYTYWENKHPTKNWTLNVTFTKFDNLRMDTKLKTADNAVKMEIPPGSSAVAILKRIDLPTGPSVGWSFKSQWK